MSDLLNKASLVMVPSGYKEDTVYSVVPSDGSGDLSFTRASNGTRVNSAGLVEVAPWNLVLYSEDFSNGVWTTTSTTITADNTTAPNGTATADKVEISSSSNARVQQIINSNLITGGLPCTFSVYIKSVSGTGNVGIRSGQTGLSSVFSYTNQWQRFEWTFNAYALSEIMQFCNNTLVGGADSAPSFFVWGAQLNIGSTAKSYFPTTDRLNVPRLTYQNGGGGCPSLLLEKQSTNLQTYSEQMDNAAWSKFNVSITANGGISPDGTQNADLTYITSGTNVQNYNSQTRSGLTNGATYTQSVFLKASGFTWAIVDNVSGSAGAWFNLANGTIGTVVSGSTAKIENYGNGWYRCSVTSNAFSTSGYGDYRLANADNDLTATANGTNGILAWGFQFEEGSYPTSYIPTTSSSATRVADACFKTGISSLIGQSSGTILWDLQVDQLLSNENILNIDNGSFGNTIYFIKTSSGGITTEVYASASLQCSLSYSLPSAGRYKIALAYANNDFALYINGVSRGTDSSGSVPATSRLQMGNGALGASDGKVNELVLFPTRLTNAELASLTTI